MATWCYYSHCPLKTLDQRVHFNIINSNLNTFKSGRIRSSPNTKRYGTEFSHAEVHLHIYYKVNNHLNISRQYLQNKLQYQNVKTGKYCSTSSYSVEAKKIISVSFTSLFVGSASEQTNLSDWQGQSLLTLSNLRKICQASYCGYNP